MMFILVCSGPGPGWVLTSHCCHVRFKASGLDYRLRQLSWHVVVQKARARPPAFIWKSSLSLLPGRPLPPCLQGLVYAHLPP